MASFNLILLNWQLKKKEINQNFFNNICKPLFENKKLLWKAIELFYNPKIFENISDKYEINTNNNISFLFGYRFCLNIIFSKNEKCLYYSLYESDKINYLKKNNIKYYIDSSNKNQKYTRNRYRENILPFLKKEDPNIHKKYLYYSKVLQEYQQYIDTEINNIYNKIVKNNTIDINKIKTINPFLQKNLLFKTFTLFHNNMTKTIQFYRFN